MMEREHSQYEEGNYVVPLEELKIGEEVTIYDKEGYYYIGTIKSIHSTHITFGFGKFDTSIMLVDIDEIVSIFPFSDEEVNNEEDE